MIIAGTLKKDIDEVKDLFHRDVSIEIIELQYTDAMMASTLKEIFSSKDKSPANKSGESGPRDEIGLYVIPDSNRMIIAGTKKDIDEVRLDIRRSIFPQRCSY